MSKDGPLKLTNAEISRAFAGSNWNEKFPPILTVDQAAALAQVPKATIYDWSSRGSLKGCSRKHGKHLRIWRDGFIAHLMNTGTNA